MKNILFTIAVVGTASVTAAQYDSYPVNNTTSYQTRTQYNPQDNAAQYYYDNTSSQPGYAARPYYSETQGQGYTTPSYDIQVQQGQTSPYYYNTQSRQGYTNQPTSYETQGYRVSQQTSGYADDYNRNSSFDNRNNTMDRAYDHRNTDSSYSSNENKYPQDFAANEQDRQINEKIRSKLSGWFSSGYNATLVLRTTNGIVVIEGTVDKPEDVQSISDTVRKIDGVKSINNRVMAKSQTNNTTTQNQRY